MRFIVLRISIVSVGLLLISCSTSKLDYNTVRWKPQEIAIMTMIRCLVTGGHFTRNDASKFVAQLNKEQGGQFQRVYDSIYTGVSAEANKKVVDLIDSSGGCRVMLTEFVNSEPETPFKKDIQMDWILGPIKYPDER